MGFTGTISSRRLQPLITSTRLMTSKGITLRPPVPAVGRNLLTSQRSCPESFLGKSLFHALGRQSAYCRANSAFYPSQNRLVAGGACFQPVDSQKHQVSARFFSCFSKPAKSPLHSSPELFRPDLVPRPLVNVGSYHLRRNPPVKAVLGAPDLETLLRLDTMVVPPSVELSNDRELVALVGAAKQTLLKDVPANISVRADGGSHGVPGAFIGALADNMNSRHKFPIGKLVG